jgi:hypothetical protein
VRRLSGVTFSARLNSAFLFFQNQSEWPLSSQIRKETPLPSKSDNQLSCLLYLLRSLFSITPKLRNLQSFFNDPAFEYLIVQFAFVVSPCLLLLLGARDLVSI